ncbi:tol-pal system-associated acyl-CoA thioesterase [Rubrivivax gelatinosus]|uniref:Tol-pal system-associated acyl-CoA thioesterase n=1 Tax=Rubrivivax gelatinosus TaxID=28068 RepID=A0ABS1DX14_RUBGE|nr:tol-pal system-associated acyl-CoA thioesterase [Rubrivivax gelatinosus]MBK1614159.1 tol-pal system-associated acyl-CoA thioesterase [Rubrivivax gelatinosus]MBK1713720.1 tol-pal system-associated acyl-CoA thioesterase [Rubrivivax gelatinosus]
MSAAAPFRHRVRVYWEDTDAGGVVYYANYLKFFERARTEWLRALGIGQEANRAATGTVFVVADATVSYRRPARLDDEIEVTVELRELCRASLVVAQQAWRGDELLAEGQIRVGCVAAETFRPARIPLSIFDAIR